MRSGLHPEYALLLCDVKKEGHQVFLCGSTPPKLYIRLLGSEVSGSCQPACSIPQSVKRVHTGMTCHLYVPSACSWGLSGPLDPRWVSCTVQRNFLK